MASDEWDGPWITSADLSPATGTQVGSPGTNA
jgi:hypothetical protein